MTPSAENQRRIDPDALLNEHSRQAARRYRARLADAYEDPAAVVQSFHQEASRVGPSAAADAMRANPSAFGALRAEGRPGRADSAAIARDGADLAVLAYEARIACGDSAVGARVTERLLNERIAAVGGDPGRVRETLDALQHAYGDEGGARMFRATARTAIGREVPRDAADELADLALARAALRRRAGLIEAAQPSVLAPLPRVFLQDTGAEGQRLPEVMAERLQAASDGFRTRMASAYENPVMAEALLHARVSSGGIAAIAQVKEQPHLLGPLRPGGAAQDAAQDALEWAAVAYDHHTTRGAGAAAELHACQAVEAINRSAADVERAMGALDEAIRLHGPALESRIEQGRSQQQPGRDGPGPGPGVPQGPDRASGPHADPALGDSAVDRAVHANERLAEANEISDHIRALREERSAAQAVLAKLAAEDAEVLRTGRDLRAVAGRMYQDPDGAVTAWSALVDREGGDVGRATAKVEKNPAVLGPMKSEPETGWRGRLGMRSNTDACAELPHFVKRGEAYTRATEAARAPIEWTLPGGATLRDRNSIRAGAQEVVNGRVNEIKHLDSTLRGMGGVKGNEVAAQKAMAGLTGGQTSKVVEKVAGSKGLGVAQAAQGLLQKAAMAARLARTLGEGPAM